MPIAFPPEERGPDWSWASTLAGPSQIEIDVDITNLGLVGADLSPYTLDPGLGFDGSTSYAVNLRNLNGQYEHADQQSDKFGAILVYPIPDGVWIPQTDWAASNRAITGISRDSTGTILGGAQLDLFVTSTDQRVAQVTSDASGNFSFGNPGSGPFYIVAYKVGSPDVTGATVNTLQPT